MVIPREILNWLNDPAVLRFVELLGLIVARVLPLVVLTPVFGGRLVSSRLRFGLAAVVTLGLMPALWNAAAGSAVTSHASTSANANADAYPFALLVFREVLIGLLLALVVMVMFEAFAAFGQLLDLIRGESLPSLFDPAFQHQSSTFGVFVSQFTLAVFVTIGGLRVLVGALADSYAWVRLDAPLVQLVQSGALLDAAAGSMGRLLSIAFRLAAPGFLVVLLVDVALGLISRVARGIDVHLTGLTLKGSLVVLMLLLTIGLVLDEMTGEFSRLAGQLRAALRGG